MQQHELLISSLIGHAARCHGGTEVVSCLGDGTVVRSSWAGVERRARQVAGALDALGLAPGARVATLAWNDHRHLELYYGVSGSGRVLHTLNPRLSVSQLAAIVAQADDALLAFDAALLPLVRELAARAPGLRRWVMLGTGAAGSGLDGAVDYEDWIGAAAPIADWPALDERTASSLCFSSGSSGAPKGVLYSHRSTVLHAWAAALPDARGLAAADTVLPAVPMFHANAWGLPYAAALVGCKLVLPGPRLDGDALHALMQREGVTLGAGVPTVWLGLLQAIRARSAAPSALRRLMVGGSAPPASLLQQMIGDWGIDMRQGWGMTELSPLGTVNAPKHSQVDTDAAQRAATQRRQGRPVFGVELRLVGDDGAVLGWDGQSVGELQVRSPWAACAYLGQAPGAALVDGWLPTGDLGVIDADGCVRLTDRRGDAIKSGGEWISSVELEAIAMEHPAVLLAAAIAMPDPKWGERPLLALQLHPGAALDADALLGLYAGRVPRWWVPNALRVLDALPLGPTGKVAKAELRRQLLGSSG